MMVNKIGVCPDCNKIVSERANFCPSCGKELTQEAAVLQKEKHKKAQIELINKLIDEVNDEKTLKALKQHLQKLA